MGKKKKNSGRIGQLIFALLFIAATAVVYRYYQIIYSSNTTVNADNTFIYIESDWNRTDLVSYLIQEGIIQDSSSFLWVADQKSFTEPKAGKYKVKDGMSNNDLVNLLRSGKQIPIKLTFNTIRTKVDLAKQVGLQLELDSTSLADQLNSSKTASKYGFNSNTFFTLFIPNTYEFYWNTNAEEFIQRMAKEYKRFWNEERINKARELGLSQSEVSILASIVQAEQSMRPDEMPKVAGLYLNRIRKRIRLQSDPTLIYALGDFSIKRVLNIHKKLNSPFNTYIHSGLPPGPINLPEIRAIDAVLNYEKHSYLYMCAKADFSGYHHFARTLSQHNVYANQYRRELNKRRIYK